MALKQQMFMMQLAANATAIALVVFGILMFSWVMPKVETKLAPIIKVEKLDDIYRDHDRVCWTMHLHKVSDANRPHYEWTITPELGPDLGAGAYLADENNDQLANQDLVSHRVGERWQRRYCFNIGDRVPDVQGMRVWGSATHHRHNFWESETHLPDFVVCPIQGRRVASCQPQVIY